MQLNPVQCYLLMMHTFINQFPCKDAVTLQKDLGNEKNWSVEFHPNKCQLLRITNKHKIVDAHYMIHRKRLKLVDSAKYLGVTLTKTLSRKNHIGIITDKANNAQLFLQRNFVKIDRKAKLKYYYTYTRPVLQYTSTVWNPIDQTTLISKLEMVQRKSICWIWYNWKNDVSITKLGHSLGMKTLDTRVSVAQLKMFHNLIDNTKQVRKDIPPVYQRCIDIKFKLLFGIIKSSFPQVVGLRNILPKDFTKYSR